MIGIKPTTRVALIALAFSAAALLCAEDRMRAGLWEITSSLDGKSSPSHNTCFTPALVELGNSPVKTLREATEKTSEKAGCTLKDFKMDGHTMSMVRVCGPRTAVVSTIYSGDAFETVDTSTEAGVSKVMRMKGRRLGDCK